MRVNIQSAVLNSGANGGYLFTLMECVRNLKELRTRAMSGDSTAALQEFFELYCFTSDKEDAQYIKEKISTATNKPIMPVCPKCGSGVTVFKSDIIHRCNNDECQWSGKPAQVG